jgi:hypothetical protein
VDSLQVRYHPLHGQEGTTSTGKISRILDENEQPPEGVKVEDKESRVLIMNDHTGKETLYKSDVITEVME